jgi:hypothetical protein
MISWTIVTTGIETTSYFSSHALQTGSLTRTANGSTSSVNPFLGSVTNSFTSSESGSDINSRATIQSANETATFQTLLHNVQGAYNSRSGETQAFTYTTFYFSGQYEPPTSSESYPKLTTASGLRTYPTQHQATSTVTTVSASKFGSIQSGTAVPSNAVTASQSGGILITETVQGEATIATTTQATPTYWFFASQSTEETVDTTTTLSVTTSGVSRATVYQAEGNEIFYKISNPASYEATAKAARPLATTETRITVLPVRATVTRGAVTGLVTLASQGSPAIDLSAASSSETVPEATELTRNITQYGPDSQSSVTEHSYTASTVQTQSTPVNYTYTQFYSEDPDDVFTDSTFSQTQKLYDETLVALQANRFADPSWVASLITGFPAGISQSRYGKTAWNIDGQKGSQTTPTHLEYLISAHTGSFTRGQVTIANVTNQSITLSVPSITYKTTDGTVATTASTVIGVEGQPQLIGDDITLLEHLGGGAFAESWTVIDRVQPEYVYSDLKNSLSVSHLGNDTSYSQGQSSSVSYLTFEPHLLGGGLFNGNNPAPDAIFWTESRNPPDPA